MKKCKLCKRCEEERSWILKNGTVVEIGAPIFKYPHRFGVRLPKGTLSWAKCDEFDWSKRGAR